jgi:hypothetical protein
MRLAFTLGCSAALLAPLACVVASAGCTTIVENGSSDAGSDAASGGDTAAGVDSGAASGEDSGTTPGFDGSGYGGPDAGNDGGCAPAASVTGIPAYTGVTQQSACSMADVSAFVAACEATNQAGPCDAWFTSNPTCGSCIEPAADGAAGVTGGALLFDAVGQAFLNAAGCVQVIDGNTTCAGPLQELTLCEVDACDSVACQATTSTDYQNCQTTADEGACTSQVTAANAGCGGADYAEGGALSVCDPGTAAGTIAIIYTICGNGQ